MSEPRWLTDEEQHAWRQLAAIVLKLPTELERQLQRDDGLTHFEYWVLSILSETPGRSLQLRDLAAASNASQSRLSHVIKRLEARGWVRREPCPDDGRASNAVLTERGWDKIVAAAPAHVERVREVIFDGLTARDVADMARVLGKIATRLEAGVPESGACESA